MSLTVTHVPENHDFFPPIISPFGTKGTSTSSKWFSILVVGHPLFAYFCILDLLYVESQSVC